MITFILNIQKDSKRRVVSIKIIGSPAELGAWDMEASQAQLAHADANIWALEHVMLDQNNARHFTYKYLTTVQDIETEEVRQIAE